MAWILSGALLLTGIALVVGALLGVKRCRKTPGCPYSSRGKAT